MRGLLGYCDSLLAKGRAYFTKEGALVALGGSPKAFISAAERLAKKGRIVPLKRGFYLVLRPEDRVRGAPDPAHWIGPLMRHLKIEYRVSLLRAAAFHGSAQQAAMVFQVIAPKQLSEIAIGRQRVQFVYQSPAAFAAVNRAEWLELIKTDAGYATVAGTELTLLDFCRYFHRAAGIGGAAQAVHDLGRKASPHILAEAAVFYENAAVRRLGFLLEHFGYHRQSRPLLAFAGKAKSFAKLEPSLKPAASTLIMPQEKNAAWKLLVNTPIEIDH
jgi:predicted transcriptional regulator of viral defense system